MCGEAGEHAEIATPGINADMIREPAMRTRARASRFTRAAGVAGVLCIEFTVLCLGFHEIPPAPNLYWMGWPADIFVFLGMRILKEPVVTVAMMVIASRGVLPGVWFVRFLAFCCIYLRSYEFHIAVGRVFVSIADTTLWRARSVVLNAAPATIISDSVF